MPSWRQFSSICAALFVFSQILFLINIQFPRTVDFDEFHYVPSAKQFLALKENQNWEHPPLAKELMAVGIGVFGDRPIGWRYMSTLFGSLTLVGMFAWGLVIFGNPTTALWVALLTLANQMLYVQSRIGMLDTFMMAFIVWALVAFCAAWTFDKRLSPGQLKRLLRFCGLMLGLATACKWFAVIPWAFCGMSVIGLKVLQSWRAAFADPQPTDWYQPDQWRGIPAREWLISLLLVPLVAYYVTFLPYLLIQGTHVNLWDILVNMQIRMWDGQGRVVSSHPYMSTWTQWAIIKRPIWYAFDREGMGQNLSVRGVLLLGNPFVLWSGLLAVLFCFCSWIKSRRRDAFLIFMIYAFFYFSWAVIPRKVAFFYYYFPAGMTLSLALAYFFERGEKNRWLQGWVRWAYLGVATGFFIYFFPISAALRIPASSFIRWMWFGSWI